MAGGRRFYRQHLAAGKGKVNAALERLVCTFLIDPSLFRIYHRRTDPGEQGDSVRSLDLEPVARSHGIPAPWLDGSAGNGRRLLDSAALKVKSAAWKCQSYMGHTYIIEHGNCDGCDSIAHQHELACFGRPPSGNVQCIALCPCIVAKGQADGSMIGNMMQTDILLKRLQTFEFLRGLDRGALATLATSEAWKVFLPDAVVFWEGDFVPFVAACTPCFLARNSSFK